MERKGREGKIEGLIQVGKKLPTPNFCFQVRKTIEEGITLGEALSESRMSISPQHAKVLPADSTWGAYQHYGNPNARLVDNFVERNPEAAASTKQKANSKRNKK